MKKSVFLVICIWSTFLTYGQSNKYLTFVYTADSLYKIKEYKKSAISYSEAFRTNEWKGQVQDRYNAACTWALTNNPDSAFFQLNKIFTKGNYIDYEHLITDKDLSLLHNDIRWKTLLEIITQNKEKAEVTLDKSLVSQLDSIHTEYKKNIQQWYETEKKFGLDSKEMIAHGAIVAQKDSINLIKIKAILDKYGWLGEEIVGDKGVVTLVLMIQKSDPKTQEKYLPMILETVRKKYNRLTEEI